MTIPPSTEYAMSNWLTLHRGRCCVVHACDLNTRGKESSWETSLGYSYTIYKKSLGPDMLVQDGNPNHTGGWMQRQQKLKASLGNSDPASKYKYKGWENHTCLTYTKALSTIPSTTMTKIANNKRPDCVSKFTCKHKQWAKTNYQVIICWLKTKRSRDRKHLNTTTQ